MLECGDDVFVSIQVIRTGIPGPINQGEREEWPDIQGRPRGPSDMARNSQVKMPRKCKVHLPPPSTYVHQYYPPLALDSPDAIVPCWLYSGNGKYFQEDIIGEHVDSCLVCINWNSQLLLLDFAKKKDLHWSRSLGSGKHKETKHEWRICLRV